jgi:3',5'-nucleoside bisphosphate phosphatase
VPLPVDLHTHTDRSDGCDAVPVLMAKARERRVRVVAITDHSTVTWDDAVRDEAERHGVRLLTPGVEVSTIRAGHKHHVLAYGRGVLDEGFREFAFRPTAIKNRVYEAIADDLRREGRPLPPTEVMLRGAPPPGPSHPGKVMLGKRVIAAWLEGPRDELRTLLAERYAAAKERFPERYVDTVETIERARRTSALPVLAHPWWQCRSGVNDANTLEREIGEFKEAGLAGIEVSSRHDDPASIQRKRALARRLGLLAFAASDYHGDGRNDLGQIGLSEADLEGIVETASERFGCDLSA